MIIRHTYDYQGNPIDILTPAFNNTVNSVAHRGYSDVAPENTLPAYLEAKKRGFSHAECDVCLTSDRVPVLLHDNTIDRTSNGSGAISSLTFEQVRSYDFGSWKSAEYAGTKIPSFEEFIILCKDIGLYPYIELKTDYSYTTEELELIVDQVEANGMKGKVTYISFGSNLLEQVKNIDAQARLGFITWNQSASEAVSIINSLKTGYNEVFIDGEFSRVTESYIAAYRNAGISVEVWTVDSSNSIVGLNKYITGVTSNSLIAGEVLYDKANLK